MTTKSLTELIRDANREITPADRHAILDLIEQQAKEIKDARRTAEYWKAEHNASNARIAESESHRNDLADKIVEQQTEIGALKSRIAALESAAKATVPEGLLDASMQAMRAAESALSLASSYRSITTGFDGEKIETALKLLRDAIAIRSAPTAATENGDGRDAWQPIETAPKDGTELLLIATRHSMLMPHPETIVGAYRQGWWSGPSTLSHVTHWMPLPAAPAALSQQGEQG